MTAWLQQRCQQHPQQTAVCHAGQTLSYAELAATIKPYAAALNAQGVRAGTRVALLCETTPACVYAIHALIWLGATLQPLPARQPLAALQAQLKLLASDAVVDVTDSLNPADIGCAVLRWEQAAAEPPACARLAPEHVLTELLTSGSTAAAKPVPLSVANHLASATAVAQRLQQTPDDCWLLCLPLHHIGGLAIVIRSVICGSSLYLLQRFDAVRVRRLLAANRDITLASMVPTMLQRLLADDPSELATGLRALLIGGAPAAAELLQQAQAAMLPVLPTYGMTEACSQLATLAPEHAASLDFKHARGVAGTPLPGVELCLVDAQWQAVPPAQIGRILARGAMISQAVVEQQSLPAPWHSHGWLLTDDYGWRDGAGMLHISHRRSDVIISGGENIRRDEVEQALLQTGLLADVAVIGLADAEWGQVVAALVVPHDPDPTNSATDAANGLAVNELIDMLQTSLRQHLAAHKLPRRWRVLATLPRTETGKLRQQDCQRLLLETGCAQPSGHLTES
jgi:o-succinylbenzoate---CoA ligase